MRFLILILITCFGCGPEPTSSHIAVNTLEAEIDTLVAAYPEATVAVALRDPKTNVVLNRNPDRSFHAASTMKIPVMIELYRQANLGRFSLDDELLVMNSFRSIVDSSLYSIEDDSDDAIYARLGEKMSIRELNYQMITVSSNLATNLLIDYVSADSVQNTAEQMGIKNMKVLRGVEDIKAYRLGLSNSTTAADLAVLLEALNEGKAVSPAADAEMVDVLKAQQFNEMIPAGLPATTEVAHKTGWITKIHHDAAIVYPEQDASYVLVILIEGIQDQEDAAMLGAAITKRVHSVIRSSTN